MKDDKISIESYNVDDARTGYRIPAIHCRDFNAACDRFMKSRGQGVPSDFKFGYQTAHRKNSKQKKDNE